MQTRPDPLLEETAAEIVSDSIWNLLEQHGMKGLPLTQFSREESEGGHVKVQLSSGHTVWVAVLPQAPRHGTRYFPRHRKHR